MIITKLIGGLGNQMFQYAAARRLAHIHYTDLKLDITSYESYKLRKFELDNFNITAQIASKKEIERFVKIPYGVFEKIIFSLIPSFQKRNKSYYEERFYHFDPKVLTLPDGIYLSGYWQSEKYFTDVADIIRKEFTVKYRPNQQNLDMLKQIESTNSVSIHIRGGDFVTDSNTTSLHGLCDMNYFQKAISIVSSRLSTPHFYVFSDDIAWAKKNLRINYPVTFVESNLGKRDYEDLRLMSSCKHNIIVNSTFGWWGAWLNKNKSKIIITPKQWYQDGPVDTEDLIPNLWIII